MIKRDSLKIMAIVLMLFTATIQIVNSENITHTIVEDTRNLGKTCAKPWIVFNRITNVDPYGSEATFKATLISKGFTDCCDVFFVWDTEWHMNWWDYSHQTDAENYCGFCPHFFSCTETGFQRGVKYNVRAVAQNLGSSDQTFAYYFTPGEPDVYTRGVSNIDYSGATLQGELMDNGDAETQVCFYYDTKPCASVSSYSYSTPYETLSDPGLFECTISGQPIGETIYYIAYAINDASDDVGARKDFDLWGAHFNWEDADNNYTGTTINFDASISCGDDSITLYEWDFENDSIYDYSDSNPYVSYDYGDINPHECKLKITNSYGHTDTEIKTVQAVSNNQSNTPPNKPNPPIGQIIGQTDVSYTYSTSSYDNDGDLIKYGWDWDGDDLVDEWTDYYQSAEICEIDHSWENPGEYDIKVKAQDIKYAKSSFSNILTVIIEGGDDEENQRPTVDINFPSNEDTVSDIVLIEGVADDSDGGVSKVEIKIGEEQWDTCSGTNQWSYNWNTLNIEDGDCIIKSKSFDGEDYSVIALINVNVQNDPENNFPPTVEIIEPIEGETVSDIITISGSADDQDGSVEKVEVKINNEQWQLCTGINNWSYDFDSTLFENGECNIKAQSFDGELYSDYDEITININNEGEENNDPILSFIDGYDSGINKKEGYADTEFEFKIHYFDEDQDSPNKKELKIKYPDEHWETYEMNGFGFDSTYSFSKQFQIKGLYHYYFEFTDGEGGVCRYPKYNSNYFTVNDQSQQGAEKPELNIGDTWNYNVKKLNAISDDSSYIKGKISNLQIEVIGKSAEYYTLEYNGIFTGDVQIVVEIVPEDDDGAKGVNITKKINDVSQEFSGEIKIDRNNFGIKEIDISTELEIEVSPLENSGLGFLKFRTWFLIKYDIEMSTDESYDFFNFPVNEDETWNVEYKSFAINSKIRLYIWKRIGKYWKKLYEKDKPSGLAFELHNNTCTEIINGKYRVESDLDDGVSYLYSPDKKAVTESSGKLIFWSDSIVVDYEMVLKGCPPNKPSTPNGNNRPETGIVYKYSASSLDPNGDQIQYGWDWNGDKSVDEWTSFYDSGDSCTVTHSFTKQELNGNNLHVKARDINLEESPWSDPLNIKKSKPKFIDILHIFLRNIEIKNKAIEEIMKILF